MRILLASASLASLAALTLSAAACGGDDKGNGSPPMDEAARAHLTIIGAADLVMDFRSTQTVQVRYHDQNDRPLVGTVSFSVEGASGDHGLSASSGVTDANGIVNVEIRTGIDISQFAIEASAESAADVSWSVAVRALSPLKLSGTYTVTSHFDLTANPPPEDSAAGVFLAISESPGTWLLQNLADDNQLPAIVAVLGGALIDQLIEDRAPSAVVNLVELAADIRSATESVGTVSELKILEEISSGYLASQELIRYEFDLDGDAVLLSARELNLDLPAQEIELSVRSGSGDDVGGEPGVDVHAHDRRIHWGSALAWLANHEIPTRIDSRASNLGDLLLLAFDCDSVGAGLADQVPLLSQSAGIGLCEIGVRLGAGALLAEIQALDDDVPLTLNISGGATPVDKDRDYIIEKLADGAWAGTVDYDGTVSEIGDKTATFSAVRNGSPIP